MLAPAQLAAVQTSLGIALRDVYFLMGLLALSCMFCSAWLSGARSQAAETDADGVNIDIAEDPGLAMASEF
jgi:hypothetical protein